MGTLDIEGWKGQGRQNAREHLEAILDSRKVEAAKDALIPVVFGAAALIQLAGVAVAVGGEAAGLAISHKAKRALERARRVASDMDIAARGFEDATKAHGHIEPAITAMQNIGYQRTTEIPGSISKVSRSSDFLYDDAQLFMSTAESGYPIGHMPSSGEYTL